MRKITFYALAFLAVLLVSCDLSFLFPKDSEMDSPLTIGPDSNVSFVCEREEMYYFKPVNNYLPTVYYSVYGYFLTFYNVPIFENYYPSTYRVSVRTELLGSGVTEGWWNLDITSIDYLRQLFFYLSEPSLFNAGFHVNSDSFALPEAGNFYFDYRLPKTVTVSVPFHFLFGEEPQYWSRTYTVTDTWHTVSCGFYRYKSFSVKFPDSVTIEQVFEYAIVKEFSYNKNSLNIELHEYYKPLNEDVCMLILRSEDGRRHQKYISIGD